MKVKTEFKFANKNLTAKFSLICFSSSTETILALFWDFFFLFTLVYTLRSTGLEDRLSKYAHVLSSVYLNYFTIHRKFND